MIWMRSSRVVSLMSTLRFMGTPLCRDWKVTVRMSCGMVNNLHSHVEVLIVPLNDAFARRLSFITLGLYRPFRRGVEGTSSGRTVISPNRLLTVRTDGVWRKPR